MKHKVSKETQEQALKVAKGIQKPGQTKEQTKLIAQGIEKGIAEYKKQHKKELREKDKLRKKQVKQQNLETEHIEHSPETVDKNTKLPWLLLIVSWVGFIGYLVL